MNSTREKPLLSFVVLAFNQERFVEHAVQGALAQTYSPLEIILSDDASKDGTFPIMERLANAYRGPHSIKLNRNPSQLGLGGHVDAVSALAAGDLIFMAAGDDISLPERTETMFQAWDKHGRQATSLYSDYTSVPEDFVPKSGENQEPQTETQLTCISQKVPLAEFVRNIKPNVYGCTHAFSPKLYKKFGPLSKEITYEDMALSFRSHGIGSLLYVRKPLILYRRHTANLSFHSSEGRAANGVAYSALEEKRKRMLQGFLRGYNRFEADLETLVKADYVNGDEEFRIRAEIERGRRNLKANLVLAEGLFQERIRAFISLYRNGVRGGTLASAGLRCLPRRLYRTIRIARNRFAQ
jgi:glycosyltransferase involved in cell wall biosynthesis